MVNDFGFRKRVTNMGVGEGEFQPHILGEIGLES
jgi:hypothetical protein